MANANEQSLRNTIEQADAAYANSSSAWFSFLADDVVIYAINQTTPIHGRAAYQELFENSLVEHKRTLNVLLRNIQFIENTGVVAQTVQIEQDQTVSTVRQSIVWQWFPANQAWKIKHLHTALVGSPTGTTRPTDLKSVQILNEKIATVSVVLGLAQ